MLIRGTLERALESVERIAGRLRYKSLRVRVAADRDFPVHEAIVRQARRIRANLIVAERDAGRASDLMAQVRIATEAEVRKAFDRALRATRIPRYVVTSEVPVPY